MKWGWFFSIMGSSPILRPVRILSLSCGRVKLKILRPLPWMLSKRWGSLNWQIDALLRCLGVRLSGWGSPVRLLAVIESCSPMNRLASSTGPSTDMIFKVLRHIVTDGADRAVLLSSHDPRACDYVDRVLDMEDGVLEEV